MTVVSGIDGSVTWTSGYSTKVDSWTVNVVAEEVETTALGDRWKRFLPGVCEWSGQFTARMDPAEIATTGDIATVTTNSSELKIGNQPASATFAMDDSTKNLAGDIIITGIDASQATASGAGSFTFTFRGDNELAVT